MDNCRRRMTEGEKAHGRSPALTLRSIRRPIHLASIRTEKRRPEKRTPEKAPRELSWTNILKEIMKGRRLESGRPVHPQALRPLLGMPMPEIQLSI